MKNLELLSKIALLAVKTDNFENQINDILAITGHYTGVSRTYIFIDDNENKFTNNEFEWCNEGINPQISELQGVPYEMIPSWRKILLEKGKLFSQNIFELPEDVIAILEPQGILSIIVYPLFIDNKLNGFIGFDECKVNKQWEQTDIDLLATIAGIVANIYNNHNNLLRIRELSLRDALTNSYNRRYVFNRFQEDLIKYHKTNLIFSVTIIDIDHFKNINDTYGHVAGDFILKEFTKLISENIRENDIFGRYGGEEFIVISYHLTRDKTIDIVTRLLDIVRNKTFHYDGNDIKFTFSAGIADVLYFNKENITVEKIVNLADRRLYKAKETGRNKIIYQGEEILEER